MVGKLSWVEHTDESLTSIKCAVTIVSDSLFNETLTEGGNMQKDESGLLALEKLADFGVGSTNIDYLPDDLAGLKARITEGSAHKIDFLLFIGGTGISKRDVTVEAVEAVIEKKLEGFGEEFRRRSIEAIGARGILSRAIAGTYKRTLVVAVPGSPNAVDTALDVILPVLGHIFQQLRKNE